MVTKTGDDRRALFCLRSFLEYFAFVGRLRVLYFIIFTLPVASLLSHFARRLLGKYPAMTSI